MSRSKMELDTAIEATPDGIFVEEGQHCLLVSALPRSDETQVVPPPIRSKRRRHLLWGILLVWIVVAAIVAGVLVSQRQSDNGGPNGISGATDSDRTSPVAEDPAVSSTESPNGGIPTVSPTSIDIPGPPSPDSTTSPPDSLNDAPTDSPHGSPDDTPSDSLNGPNESPTESPNPPPTSQPKDTIAPDEPSESPTANPTPLPTNEPVETIAPVGQTASPTANSTPRPTNEQVETVAPVRPTRSPTVNPTTRPTREPVNTFSPTKPPTEVPSASPSKRPKTFAPIMPTLMPTPPRFGPGGQDVIALAPGEELAGQKSTLSPNGIYRLSMTFAGDVILELADVNNGEIWRIPIRGGPGATLSMQSDGNLVFRDSYDKLLWNSDTSNHPGTSLQLGNNGRLAVIASDGITPLWMEGIPGGVYDVSQASPSLTFPIRGAFYYPWFPETWSVNGSPVSYDVTLGKYSIGDRAVQLKHVQALEYAHIDLAIMSWLGPNQKNDRATITNLMDNSVERGVKWTVYHERERQQPSSVGQIRSDLLYLKKWFTWHEAWVHVEGKPVIFVSNGAGCDVSDRWMEAANGEWYVVLKVFQNYINCPVQPDSWHQNSPEEPKMQQQDFSFSVSPGFWLADEETPRLPRQTTPDFIASVHAMVDSNEPWQLITSFNEWGAGSAVESAKEWGSPSRYGRYLDVLNAIP